jgi:hypothetical protein
MKNIYTLLIAFILMGMAYTANTQVQTCSGLPTPSNTTSSVTTACTDIPFKLSLDENFTDFGFWWQWQQSSDGTIWVNIPFANDSIELITQTAPMYYRCSITCNYSGETTISTPILVGFSDFTPVYFTGGLPYLQDFEGEWVTNCALRSQPSENWVGLPSVGFNAWRRDDDGTSAGWWDDGLYGVDLILGPSNGTHYARYHAAFGQPQDMGMLELYLDCSGGAPLKMLSFDFMDPMSDDYLSAWVSTDGGANFQPIGQTLDYVDAPNWSRVVYPFTSQSPTTVLRIVANNNSGGSPSDIGIDDVLVTDYSTCMGTPAIANTLASTSAACVGAKFELSLDELYPEDWYIFEWQYSYDNVNWFPNTFQPYPGQENFVTSQSSPSWYRCKVQCYWNNEFVFSNPVFVDIYDEAQYYTGGLPFLEGFENTWASVCGQGDVPSVNWLAFPFAGNSRWKSNADYDPTYYQPDYVASEGSSWAAFFTTFSSPNFYSDLDLYLDLSTGDPARRLIFDYMKEYALNSYLTVQLSTDGGLNFTPLGDSLDLALDWQTAAFDFNSSSPTTILRFRGGFPEFVMNASIDNIRVVRRTICNGAPAPAAATATATAFCVPTSVTLSLNHDYTESGLEFQWQTSLDGATWTDLPGANNPFYSQMVDKISWFRCLVTCSASTETAVSTPIYMDYSGPVYYAGPFPYVMSFEEVWKDQCDTHDVPSIHWDNTVDTGSSSWRRNDDGASANWQTPLMVLPPTASDGDYYAVFKSTELEQGDDIGGLTLHLDCSQGGDSTWQLSFDFFNADNGMQVILLRDDGTFELLFSEVQANGQGPWWHKSVDFISSSPKTLIWFQSLGSGAAGYDYGIDNVRVNYSNAFGFVSGKVYKDLDGNCQQDPGEPPVPEKVVKFIPSDKYALTDADGNYNILLHDGDYAAEILLPLHHEMPCGSPVVTGLHVDQATQNTVNFGVRPIPGIRDLETVLTPTTATRIGFPATFEAKVRNLGTATANGVVFTLDFPVDSLFFTTSDPLLTPINGHFETAIPDLFPGQAASFTFHFTVPVDIGFLGETIALTASATHANTEANPSNNQSIAYSVFTGSYDPNDKLLHNPRPDSVNTVRPGEYVFDYTIRFQNTGTDTAFTVEIRDTFDLDFEPLGFRTVAASHPFTCEMSTEGHMTWRFENILLPDSTTNEPASHGYVRFQIPSEALTDGSNVTNNASIYFDFNPPVLTNTVVTQVEKLLWTSLDSVTLCYGDAWNGTFHYISELYSEVVSTPEIDSIFYTFLTVNPVSFTQLEISACPDELPVLVGGEPYFNAGFHEAHLQNWLNCDSTVQLYLEVKPAYQTTIDTAVSVGSIVIGTTILSDTFFVQNLTAVNGCDSTINVQATIISGTADWHDGAIGFRVFPNPAGDFLTIEKLFRADTRLLLSDYSGRVVMDKNLGFPSEEINLSVLPSGIYAANLFLENGQFVGSRRVLVLH